MPNYRRAMVKGGTYFFTVNLAVRGGTLLTVKIDALRESYVQVQRKSPFATDAIVILPDHIHAIWTLPKGDADFSTRWKNIKSGFSKRVETKSPRNLSQFRKGEAGIWQRRFWEHCIRDETDWRAHVEYIRRNPVKHGYVDRPENWPYSSFRRVGGTHWSSDIFAVG